MQPQFWLGQMLKLDLQVFYHSIGYVKNSIPKLEHLLCAFKMMVLMSFNFVSFPCYMWRFFLCHSWNCCCSSLHSKTWWTGYELSLITLSFTRFHLQNPLALHSPPFQTIISYPHNLHFTEQDPELGIDVSINHPPYANIELHTTHPLALWSLIYPILLNNINNTYDLIHAGIILHNNLAAYTQCHTIHTTNTQFLLLISTPLALHLHPTWPCPHLYEPNLLNDAFEQRKEKNSNPNIVDLWDMKECRCWNNCRAPKHMDVGTGNWQLGHILWDEM
jgi:hypothetical protein